MLTSAIFPKIFVFLSFTFLFVGHVQAQSDELPSRFHKCETKYSSGLSVRLVSAEIEELEKDNLLTAKISNETEHTIREVELWFTVYDVSGAEKYTDKWRIDVGLASKNDMEIDVRLDKSVSLDGCLLLVLADAR